MDVPAFSSNLVCSVVSVAASLFEGGRHELVGVNDLTDCHSFACWCACPMFALAHGLKRKQ